MKTRLAKKVYERYAGGDIPAHLQTRALRRAFMSKMAPLSKKLDALNKHSGIGPSLGWFTYDERTGYPKHASFAEYSWFRMCGKNIIKRTKINEEEFISTVCLGLDHNFNFSNMKQMPVVFETGWCRLSPLPLAKSTLFEGFRGLQLIEEERASTKGEALKHHNDMVTLHKQLTEQAVVSG